MNLQTIFVILGLFAANPAKAADVPHFVKTVSYGSDSKTVIQPAVLDRSAAWIVKRSPNYWVKLEAFYCAGDREKEDDPVEKLVKKANDRAEGLRRELEKRKVRPDAISISAMGQSPDPSTCITKILAGPTSGHKSGSPAPTKAP